MSLGVVWRFPRHCTAFQAVGYLLYSPPAYHNDVLALPHDEVEKVFLYLCLLCHLSLSTGSSICLLPWLFWLRLPEWPCWKLPKTFLCSSPSTFPSSGPHGSFSNFCSSPAPVAPSNSPRNLASPHCLRFLLNLCFYAELVGLFVCLFFRFYPHSDPCGVFLYFLNTLK